MSDANEDLRADIVSLQIAIAAALRGLVIAHPRPEQAVEAMRAQRELSLATLTSLPIPDRALRTYHLFWEQVLPESPEGSNPG